ncbi:4-hydroxybenzoate transporter [Paramagnetospirillum magnetotacticum MS-1]|uniref:4-hydroxybenzoate transporter n=1 Tax=Paramagnetospirillum magnetotacticum MS-1 TaxID=272627 RepID=A0A0C2YEJ5_PARME|nr:MFS transporter [Paramagnetospirillum magnetotacticum]KIL98099.1 4-hydroxybenzoate transporter [Paramagnetospirillum magnetotacticum MS-1]
MTQTNTLNIQTFLNESRFSPYQWAVFALCFFVVLLDGFDTAAIGYIAPSLLKEWGIAKPALGPVLSAALFGLAAGALSAGPLADRFGRRLVLTGATLLFALASLGSSYAGSLDALTVLRFVTGIGLGAAMPNAVTLISEYCPDQRRSLLTNAMFAGFPLGAALGGFLAAWMIPQWGWRSVLVLGGIAPLALVVLMLTALPESIRYMVARKKPTEHIRKVLARISAAAAAAQDFVMTETAAKTPAGKAGLGVVLSRSYLVGSMMMWLAYFMGLVIFYGLINWMPLLLKDAGLDPKSATLISALFPLGGVGAIFFGWLMDRANGNKVIAAGYVLTALLIFGIGQAVGNVGILVALVLVAGTLMNTAQSSMPALAAGFYPTSGRATGVAWMLGMGRFGGIAGSTLVAELSRRQMSFSEMFTIIAIPGLIAAAGLIIKQMAHPETPAEHDVAVSEAHEHAQEAQLGGH